MKLSEARALCADIQPVRLEIGIRCQHLNADGETCLLGRHFVCPVFRGENKAAATAPTGAAVAAPTAPVLAPTADPAATTAAAVAPNSGAASAAPGQPSAAQAPGAAHGERWSLSRVECGLDCLRKYFLRYIAKAPESDHQKALVLGSAFHKHREAIDNGSQRPAWPDVEPEDLVKLRAVVEAYEKARPFPIGKSEVELTFDYKGKKFLGYIDAVSKDDLELYEFKYSQDPGRYSKFIISRQCSVYLHGFPNAKRVNIVVAQKPRQRRSKEESIQRFASRVNEATDASTFNVRTYVRDDFFVERELDELVAGADLIMMAMKDIRSIPSCRSSAKCDAQSCSYATFCTSRASGCGWGSTACQGCPASQTCNHLAGIKVADTEGGNK